MPTPVYQGQWSPRALNRASAFLVCPSVVALRPTTIHLGLFNADPLAGGVEPAPETGYQRRGISFVPDPDADPGEGVEKWTVNPDAIAFPQALASWGNIKYLGVICASESPNWVMASIPFGPAENIGAGENIWAGDVVVFGARTIRVAMTQCNAD